MKKKDMDICLYKLEVIKGRESVAEEWLEFLKKNREEGETLLKRERGYFEAYFQAVEEDTMYVYLFFSGEDVRFSNEKAIGDGTELDKKHFEYMQECIDLTGGDIVECLLYLNNLEDAIEY